MSQSLEAALEHLEGMLGEQSELLTRLQGRELEEHAMDALQWLQRAEELAGSMRAPDMEAKKARLRRMSLLLRRNLTLLLGEQRRHKSLLSALRPNQTSTYGRTGRLEQLRHRSAEHEQLC